jgi:hypothetical protein
MQNAPVTPQDVMTWIRESLGESQGRFEVQDLTFVRKSIRVVTARRDAFYELDAGRWAALSDPLAKPEMTEDLQKWARRCMPARPA